jgi:hypothetical protein
MGWVWKGIAFGRVPQGWIFTVRGGRSDLTNRSYLVNDAQKAALVVRINCWRVACLILLGSILATFVVAAESFPRAGFSGWMDLIIVTALFVHLATVVYGAAIPSIQWFLLRPVLAGVPAPTGFWASTLIGLGRDEARNFSTGWLVFLCLSLGFASAIWIKDALASNGDYALAICFAYCAVQTGAALFLKLSAKRSSEQAPS